ncbi:MAG: CPBP family intramembrane metalloprotease [Clostridiales bacterium]|jgi:membrane protease YdiL (CAAX protease family)|nr:type II CAAX endopeptidase family protein [Bacillota bacterium]NLK03591.1 CPBP family intramembrane metalloprotease [Clostridiales bacterium]
MEEYNEFSDKSLPEQEDQVYSWYYDMDPEELKRLEIKRRKDNKRILFYSGLYLFIMVMAVLFSQIVISLLSEKFFIELYEFDGFNGLLSIVSFVCIGYPIFILLMKKLPNSERGEFKKLSLGKFTGFLFISVAAMYTSNFIGSFISTMISNIKGEELSNTLEDFVLNGNMMITMFYGILIAPIMEELIFRKILLDKLRRFGDKPAILMTGVAFGLFHMNLQQFVYASVLGFLFAYLTIRTNTIRYAVILHMIINSIGIGVAPYVLMNKNTLGLIMVSLWMILSMTIGIVLFILNVKKVKLNRPEVPLVKKRDYIFNPGWMLFYIICLGLIILTL